MGVSGCGKTTVGRMLAEKIGCPFYDADDFHPPKNLRKMVMGSALSDADRLPWLHEIACRIALWNDNGGAVLACSALKESYRRILVSQVDGTVHFIYLAAEPSLVRARLEQRSGHFFSPTLLESQFVSLEVPQQALTVDASLTPADICTHLMRQLSPPMTSLGTGQ